MGRSNREENREENNLPPVGGGYVSDKALVVHDLDDVAWEMEGTGHKKDELTAGCTECGASHSQETNVCPDCGAVVVWLNSKAWKKAFGDPRAAIRQFEGIDLKAATPLEIDFCTAFNRKPQFANATQQKEFRRLARQYPDGYLRELMGWAQGKGFTALKSAVDNPDNLTKYRAKHDIVETLDEEPEVYRPRGWEIFAVAEE